MKQEAQGSVTDKVMRRTVELGVQVHDIQRDAEKVDRVASPSQPPTKKNQNRNQNSTARRHDLPRKKETPLRPGETLEDLPQRSCSLNFLFLR